MSAIATGLATSIVLVAATAVAHRVSGPVRTVRCPDERSDERRRPQRAMLGVLAIGGLVVAAGVGPLPVLTGVVAVLLVRRARPVLAARAGRRAAERALPDAMDQLVLSVRAGLTPQQAIRDLAGSAPVEVRPAFALVTHRSDRGQAFADALSSLPEILGASALSLADVLASSERYGLPVGPMLDQLSTEARAARRRLDEADARKLPVRLSFPLVVCTLPSFILLAIAPAVIAALSSLGSSAR
jgi:tight adherence protein C